ncbi:hypothetical protein [Microcella flavibacter]|uniref:hypothetical protein n=1 Tax=Microcella flavibacter TaxID=1804990 RepID=UPI001456EEAE|nr:hypothetical protein [Microcella flavibacter]
MLVQIEPAYVDREKLGIRTTPARVDFKRNAGQNNHFVITALVGLDAVRQGKADLGSEFSTSWSPKDVKQSSVRSREYVLVTSLAWITDLVDVYRKRIIEMRAVITEQDSIRINKLDSRGQKLTESAMHLGIPGDSQDLLMVLFAIKWRNAIVHSDAERRLGASLRADLVKKQVDIASSHRGLDVNRSIASYESGKPPTFKEVASFIAGAHSLIASIDSKAIEQMDVQEHAESLLREHFSVKFANNRQIFAQFWPGDPKKSHKRIGTLLVQLGFTEIDARASLAPEFVESVARLSASEARGRFEVHATEQNDAS